MLRASRKPITVRALIIMTFHNSAVLHCRIVSPPTNVAVVLHRPDAITARALVMPRWHWICPSNKQWSATKLLDSWVRSLTSTAGLPQIPRNHDPP
ncbi:hypothetical protein F4680DRAFT_292383 [Xylaria scruposa]|nr:hypothetical protein F4680DRAFT_292383 [Xylaria scruposa]